MPKQLLVMRHAKSSWAQPGIADFDRPLNKRGMRVAPLVATFVRQQGVKPDLIVSSTALRAKMTAKLFLDNFGGLSDDQLELEAGFYHASAAAYVEYLTLIPDESIQTIMLVGHNPGLETLIERLSGDWEIMPTAAVAHFDLGDKPWSDINTSPKPKLLTVWRPKEIGID